MVIMWPNSDGTITLSQRTAPGEVMPTLDSNPARVATADAASSDVTGSEPTLVFSIPVRTRLMCRLARSGRGCSDTPAVITE